MCNTDEKAKSLLQEYFAKLKNVTRRPDDLGNAKQLFKIQLWGKHIIIVLCQVLTNCIHYSGSIYSSTPYEIEIKVQKLFICDRLNIKNPHC